MQQLSLSAVQLMTVRFFSTTVGRYTAAFGLIVLTGLIRLPFSRVLGSSTPYLTFYFGIAAASVWVGIGPALFATALSALAGNVLFLPPEKWANRDAAELIRLLIMLAVSVGMTIVGGLARQSREQARWASAVTQHAMDTLRESEERYRALANASSQALYRMSPDWSEMRQLQGGSLIADTEKPNRNWLQEYIYPDDQKRMLEAIDKTVRIGTVFELEYRVRRADETLGWTSSRAVPVRNAAGEIVEWFGAASDITDRKRAEEALKESQARQAFLLKLSDALRSLGDPSAVQAKACRLLGEHLGTDHACYGEIRESENIAFIRLDYFRDGLTSLVGRYHFADFIEMPAALRSGRPFFIPDIENSVLLSEQTRSACGALGIRAFVSVPLVKEGRLVWTLNVTSNTPRDWTADEVTLIREVGERTWAAVEHAKAEEALHQTKKQLEAELADTKLLQGISAALIQQDNVEDLYEKIVGAAVTIMRSDYASMQMLYPEHGSGGELYLLAHCGFNPQAVRFWEWVRADSECTCGVALRTLKRVIAPDVGKCDFMRGTADLAMYLQNGIRAVQTTPLLSRTGRLVGMISTHWRNPHQPSERDLRLLDILTRQAADLIERKRAEEALKESGERFRTLADNIVQLTWMADEKGWIFWYNRRWYEYTGTTSEEMRGMSWLKVLHPDYAKGVVEKINHCFKTGEDWEDTFPLRGKDGQYRWFLSRAIPIKDEQSNVVRWFGTHTDITEQKRAEETITHQAHHDLLTGLANRMLFTDHLTFALTHAHRYQQQLAVMFFDLDRFKTINDTLGHTMGDELLKEVARRLRPHVRETDTVARIGGMSLPSSYPRLPTWKMYPGLRKRSWRPSSSPLPLESILST